MKHHLNILLLALRVLIIVMGITALLQLLDAYTAFADTSEASYLVRDTFNVIGKESPVHYEYVPYYFIGKALLMGYLIYSLVLLYKSFERLKKGDVFYNRQAAELRRAGGGIIIFAKSNYLLHCAFGAICFRDITSFLSEIPLFLGLYLGGKLILVLYYMAKKGTVLREETELTI